MMRAYISLSLANKLWFQDLQAIPLIFTVCLIFCFILHDCGTM